MSHSDDADRKPHAFTNAKAIMGTIRSGADIHSQTAAVVTKPEGLTCAGGHSPGDHVEDALAWLKEAQKKAAAAKLNVAQADGPDATPRVLEQASSVSFSAKLG